MSRRIVSTSRRVAIRCVLFAGLVGLTACSSSSRPTEPVATDAEALTVAETAPTTDVATPDTATVDPTTMAADSVGASGVLTALQSGDRACYVVLDGGTPQEQTFPGSFELCEGGVKDATKMIGARMKTRTERAAIAAESCQGSTGCTATDEVDLVVDLVPVGGPGAISPLEIERLALGASASKVVDLLGAPTDKTPVVDEAATGDFVSTWTWVSKGVEAKMTAPSTSGPFSVGSLTIAAPSTLKTVSGIGLGASSADVEAAYGDRINAEESTPDTVVVGSIFGGMLFTIVDGKVTQIFVGAAAE